MEIFDSILVILKGICYLNVNPINTHFFVLCNLHYNLHICVQISRQHKALMIRKCNIDPGMNK